MRALNTKLLTGFLREKTNIEFPFQMSSMRNHTIGKLKSEVVLCSSGPCSRNPHSTAGKPKAIYRLGNSLF